MNDSNSPIDETLRRITIPDVGVIVMNWYSIFVRALELESHYQIV